MRHRSPRIRAETTNPESDRVLFVAIADCISKPIHQPTERELIEDIQYQIDTLNYEERLEMKKRVHDELANDPLLDWCEIEDPIFKLSDNSQTFLHKLFPFLTFHA